MAKQYVTFVAVVGMQNSPWQLCKKWNAGNTFRRIQLSISSTALMSRNLIKCDLRKKKKKGKKKKKANVI